MTIEPTASLDFDVTDFFVFGSSLGNVLAYRKIRVNLSYQSLVNMITIRLHLVRYSDIYILSFQQASLEKQQPCQKAAASISRPPVLQLYNLFHPSDPIACRIEPLLSARFSQVPPINVARYQKYPMGDGACLSLIEFIQSNVGIFVDGATSSIPGMM